MNEELDELLDDLRDAGMDIASSSEWGSGTDEPRREAEKVKAAILARFDALRAELQAAREDAERLAGEIARLNRLAYSNETYKEQPYSLEYSQYSKDKGMFPFHIGPLNDAIEHNLQDFEHNHRGENKWQIVFIGKIDECQEVMEALTKPRRNGTAHDALKGQP